MIDQDGAQDTTDDDDRTMLRRARTGDDEAFAMIVRTHQARALRLATAICGDSTEAYDIVQDAFVRAHHALPTVRDSDALRPWLLRIVANQAKNARRSGWRRETRHRRHAALRDAPAAGPDEMAVATVEAERLLAAIAALPTDDRSVLACRYFADLGESDTARVLGVANGTVKSRTSRALARLRLAMADPGDQNGPDDRQGGAR